jgi:DNA-binding transcriptional ArsR family regulator
MIGMTDDARDRILGQLRTGPATIARVSAGLGLPEGVVSYHLKLLEQAGLVRVAGTRRLRGVPERTYVRTAADAPSPARVPTADPQPDRAALPRPDHAAVPSAADGAAQGVGRALTGLEAAPVQSPRLLDIRQVSVDTSTFYEFAERFTALAREFSARGTPGAPVAELAIALYRPPAAGADEGYGS